jgi:transitional endoplasmic reticulum ATPase
LLTLMDGLHSRSNLVVIAATNRPDALDEALRRPGRFDREIVVGVPDEPGRREILGIHTRGMPLAEDVDLRELARTTHGFVGADLAALAREAAIEAVRRIMPRLDFERQTIPPEVLDSLRVDRTDFLEALKRVQPSAMREVMVQAPTIGWADVGGLDDAQAKLKEGVELPLKTPEAFHRLGIRPAKGFLLYGPPGTGKTLLAKAVAKEAEANFIAIKSSDLLSKWYGESEQQIARLFARARQVAPCVIFIDEIDSLVPARGTGVGEPQVTARVVNTILAEMDGLEELQSVVLIGATNRPNLVDPALLRPVASMNWSMSGRPAWKGAPISSRFTPGACPGRRRGPDGRGPPDRALHRRRSGRRGAPRRPQRHPACRRQRAIGQRRRFRRCAGRFSRHGDRGNGSGLPAHERRAQEARGGARPHHRLPRPGMVQSTREAKHGG